MNKTRLIYFTIHEEVELVSRPTRMVIAGFYLLMMCLNTSLNIASAYLNIKLNHYKNQSMRLVLYISIVGVLYAVFGYTAHIVILLDPEQLQRSHKRLLLFIPNMFSFLCAYMTMFIGLDRFFLIIFLERYRAIITRFRFNILFLAYLLVSLAQSSLMSFGWTPLGMPGYALYSINYINSVFIVATVVLNVISIIKLKSYNRRSRHIATKTRGMVKLAATLLVILTVSYLPIYTTIVFANSLVQTIGAETTAVLLHVVMLLSLCNSSGNAIAYLKINSRRTRPITLSLSRVNTARQNIIGLN